MIEEVFDSTDEADVFFGVEALPLGRPNGFELIELGFPESEDIGFDLEQLGHMPYLIGPLSVGAHSGWVL